MTYAISDLHGCFNAYQAMLQKIDFSPDDTLYVLGDVIDRGPDGVRILQDMMGRPNVIPLMGNHELTAALALPFLMDEVTKVDLNTLNDDQMLVLQEWIANGGGTTLRALEQLSRKEREEILEYIRGMNAYAEVEVGGNSFVLTHAGLSNFAPDKPLDSYALPDFIFGRPKTDTEYYPDRILVFGHTPTRFLSGENKIYRNGNAIDIDCGCVSEGGQLGCLCLDTLDEFYVSRQP